MNGVADCSVLTGQSNTTATARSEQTTRLTASDLAQRLHYGSDLFHLVWPRQRRVSHGICDGPDERLLDPVTAVSGSGPAYVFWFIEQLAAFAERSGIPPQDALRLAKHCVLGAAKLALESAEPPAQLRKNVTSKGGTTEAALKVFEQENLGERFAKALAAATRRGGELAEELGKD